MGELLLDGVLFLTRLANADQLDRGRRERLGMIANAFPRLDELAIEQYFSDHPRRGDTSEPKRGFVFLPMVQTPPLVPILSMSYDFDRGDASLQAAVFVEKGISKAQPTAFGYRYEQPEGPGRHDYWHAQPIHELRKHDGTGTRMSRREGWRPDDTPAFPLDAERPIDLLVCLMISLYGLREAATMQANGFENKLLHRIRLMRSCPRPPGAQPPLGR